MQLQVLILVALVLMEKRVPGEWQASPLAALACVTLPAFGALIVQWLAVRRAEHRLDGRHHSQGEGGVEAAIRAERAGTVVGWAAIIGLGVATLGFGWLASIRAVIGNWPAIDEIVALAPPLLAIAASWWVHEPLERRIRDASLISRIDRGLTVPPVPTRAAFVVERFRSHVLLMLAPILVVLALGEILTPRVGGWVAVTLGPDWSDWATELTLVGCAAATYLVSPLIARLVLALRPLPVGELRDDLLEVCARAGVRVSEVLLWDTRHATVNGAVMGVTPWLRYVMLTDALLEVLPRNELRAVMAHEIGHVRRRHLPWMLGCIIVLLIGSAAFVEWPLGVVLERLPLATWSAEELEMLGAWVARVATIAATVVALVGFGWVSRRFERQADTFAVQYLSRASGNSAVTTDAVLAMRGALASVASHAGVDPRHHSWRHGSIHWRRTYLAGLVGRPLDRLPIDRTVRRLKLATVLGLGAAVWLLLREAAVDRDRYDHPVTLRGSVPSNLTLEVTSDECVS
ncbi:MAG: M48 family metallopeptidase [Phycisphaerae bacterium]|nr:M48 family metallopeptidase [Phycisphaerae bacterium]